MNKRIKYDIMKKYFEMWRPFTKDEIHIQSNRVISCIETMTAQKSGNFAMKRVKECLGMSKSEGDEFISLFLRNGFIVPKGERLYVCKPVAKKLLLLYLNGLKQTYEKWKGGDMPTFMICPICGEKIYPYHATRLTADESLVHLECSAVPTGAASNHQAEDWPE